MADAFALQTGQRTSQLLRLVADKVRAKLTVRARNVAVLEELVRKIEDNGFGKR